MRAEGLASQIFSHGGARVQDALAMFDAGEPLEVVADEFGVPEAELKESVRVALRRVASASMAPSQQVSCSTVLWSASASPNVFVARAGQLSLWPSIAACLQTRPSGMTNGSPWRGPATGLFS